MEAKVSLDTGENITKLLEKLANQIGTTVDKVFPWYVKQAIIEGYTFFIVLGITLIIGSVVVLVTRKEAIFKEYEWNFYATVNLIGYIILGINIAILAFGAGYNIAKIINPEYHAMSDITNQLGRLK